MFHIENQYIKEHLMDGNFSLENAAGLISLFQRPTFPRVAVWYPVSDGGDTFPNCELPALKDPDLTFWNTSLTQMGEDCIISIDRKCIKFLRVLEALHQ